jgi:hypothetical protein
MIGISIALHILYLTKLNRKSFVALVLNAIGSLTISWSGLRSVLLVGCKIASDLLVADVKYRFKSCFPLLINFTMGIDHVVHLFR